MIQTNHYFQFAVAYFQFAVASSYQLPGHCLVHSHSVKLSLSKTVIFLSLFWQISPGKKQHVSLLQWNLPTRMVDQNTCDVTCSHGFIILEFG
jgi:hypothetical protein